MTETPNALRENLQALRLERRDGPRPPSRRRWIVVAILVAVGALVVFGSILRGGAPVPVETARTATVTPEAGKPAVVMTWPMSIGRMDWATPLGTTSIVAKVKRPTWYPPESVRKEHEADGRPLPRTVPPGPDNPLGIRALNLGWPSYRIHGTNDIRKIGRQSSSGCIGLFNEHILEVYDRAQIGTPVLLV